MNSATVKPLPKALIQSLSALERKNEELKNATQALRGLFPSLKAIDEANKRAKPVKNG